MIGFALKEFTKRRVCHSFSFLCSCSSSVLTHLLPCTDGLKPIIVYWVGNRCQIVKPFVGAFWLCQTWFSTSCLALLSSVSNATIPPSVMPVALPTNRSAEASAFRVLDGIWHKKHRLLKAVPHTSIDTKASWANSDYYSWRFGYRLHLLCNRYRFPLMATVTTAFMKDYRLLKTSVAPLQERLGVVVADSRYFASRFLQAIYDRKAIVVTTPYLFKVSRRMSHFNWTADAAIL